jgi:hypothetical protein
MGCIVLDLIAGRRKRYFSTKTIQIGTGTNPTFYSVVPGFVVMGKAAGAWS